MKYFNIAALTLLCLLFVSCGLVKHVEVPIQTIEKVVYRDTTIYIRDSIKISVPYERVKEVVAILDTSYIKTGISESIAYVDTLKRKIHHTLTQSGYVHSKLDTIVKLQYVDKIIKNDVPIKVEVVKYKRDALFWVLTAWAIICILLVLVKLFVLKK